MKTTKLPALLLALTLLASCAGNETTSDDTTSSGGTTTSQTTTSETPASSEIADSSETPPSSEDVTSEETSVAPAVTVEIADPETLDVYDNTSTTLSASVTNASADTVTWSSSNSEVATVDETGLVTFLNVSADTTVTITATSTEDTTASDSVTFNVEDCVIRFDLSYGGGEAQGSGLDTSMFDLDGTVITETYGDVGIVYDLCDTKWYVEAEITLDDFNPSDSYPKFGIISADSNPGKWSQSGQTYMMYYANCGLDGRHNMSGSGFNTYSVVTGSGSSWSWGNDLGATFYCEAADQFQQGEPFKLGLLRDGTTYYQYALKDGEIVAYGSFTYTGISADTPSYPFIGGFGCQVTVGGFKSATGDDVEAYYETPSTISLSSTSENVGVDASFTLTATTDITALSSSAITWSSDNVEVATVVKASSATATVTGLTEGTANITATLSNGAAATCAVSVIDSAIYVTPTPDGTLDDSFWTGINPYRLSKTDTSYMDLYAIKLGYGFYLFADIYVASEKTTGQSNTNWWENENFECRIGYTGSLEASGQLWASGNKTWNFDAGYVSDTALDSTTGLYHVTMEMYYTYSHNANFTLDSTSYIWFGFNPAAGWVQTGSLTFTDTGLVAA